MIFSKPLPPYDQARRSIQTAYRQDEAQCLETLLAHAEFTSEENQRIAKRATEFVIEVRKERLGKSGLDSFLLQYDLSSEEGITLMCLAESLLRIPDKETRDDLIRDKIASANWQVHLGKSSSVFVNAATWALMLTGKVLSPSETHDKKLSNVFQKLLERGGEPVIRKAIAQAMKILGRQFVMGQTIREAVKRAKDNEKQGYRYSYDMLGEAARTESDAEKYFQAYLQAVKSIGKAAKGRGPIHSPGISIKLSALHPRYEFAHRDSVMQRLLPRLQQLAQLAAEQNINMTIDAEEADRLTLSLDLVAELLDTTALGEWQGFGMAVQSYQRRAWYVIDFLNELAQKHQRRMMIRLIKGAYWDTEIKLSQMQGLSDYPVFTRKANTDVSFIACAKKLFAAREWLYPQFATHNAHSVAAILEIVGDYRDFEFQCLHGMGQALYDQVVDKDKLNIPARIYAPVGGHEELLAYLVRRLLENGANSSFVNRIVDAKAPIEAIIADPVKKVRSFSQVTHPQIAKPENIFGHHRRNSQGIDLSDIHQLEVLDEALQTACSNPWVAHPLVDGDSDKGKLSKVSDPSLQSRKVGDLSFASQAQVETALSTAENAFEYWDATPIEQRAACLMKIADLYQQHHTTLMAMLIREAGKTIPDALSEIREAIDFCRYYAMQAGEHLAKGESFTGYTGESNWMKFHGRGPMVCISPWNFPLAIFTGQVVAALVTGNPVLAKPAEQTSLIAHYAVNLMYEAGVPKNVLQLLPGLGETVGAQLVNDNRIQGAIFTGSTQVARLINQSLASRRGPIATLIAETGGLNAMLVDSSALPEQLTLDVIQSAFGSAGQRCSACRVLFLQDDIADKMIEMIKGAMAELQVGDPMLLSTDVGPVIDEEAYKHLQAHRQKMQKHSKVLFEVTLPKACEKGYFVPPSLYELESLKALPEEVFGPILHVIRYRVEELDQVIDSINATGYGLTFGIHTRIDERVAAIQQRVRVGNCYVNRNMIGAVVGVQPFGGEGLSGTGPKAGGPHYLMRLCTERVTTINTTAAGGNASLMSLQE